MQQLMFKLDQDPNGRGLRCDSDGLFLGRDALLQKESEGNFEARPDFELRKAFGSVYGDETDWESRIRSVKLVATALNKSDTARAMMTAVLMRLPDPLVVLFTLPTETTRLRRPDTIQKNLGTNEENGQTAAGAQRPPRLIATRAFSLPTTPGAMRLTIPFLKQLHALPRHSAISSLQVLAKRQMAPANEKAFGRRFV